MGRASCKNRVFMFNVDAGASCLGKFIPPSPFWQQLRWRGGSWWQPVAACITLSLLTLLSPLCLCINSKVLILSERGASTLITYQLQTLRGRTVDSCRWQQASCCTSSNTRLPTPIIIIRGEPFMPDFAHYHLLCMHSPFSTFAPF